MKIFGLRDKKGIQLMVLSRLVVLVEKQTVVGSPGFNNQDLRDF